ncbi:MAG: hypothetical protein Q3962_06365, partial [Corynebacterium sp.]|nr:hypothetical protein [Corynebacterium sp.]
VTKPEVTAPQDNKPEEKGTQPSSPSDSSGAKQGQQNTQEQQQAPHPGTAPSEAPSRGGSSKFGIIALILLILGAIGAGVAAMPGAAGGLN